MEPPSPTSGLIQLPIVLRDPAGQVSRRVLPFVRMGDRRVTDAVLAVTHAHEGGRRYARSLALPASATRYGRDIAIDERFLATDDFRFLDGRILGWARRPELGFAAGLPLTGARQNWDPDFVAERSQWAAAARPRPVAGPAPLTFAPARRASPVSKNDPYLDPSFELLVQHVKDDGVKTWAAIEDQFLTCVSNLDTVLVAGQITEAQRKSGSRYFNDLVRLLAQNRTGRAIAARAKRSGIGLNEHDLDLCYPPEKEREPTAAAETKLAGMPQHEKNKKSSKEKGRPAIQDIDKRLREIGFNSVDLEKAHPGLLFFSIYAVRVADDGDAAGVQRRFKSMIAAKYTHGFGIFLFEGIDAAQRTTYRKVALESGCETIDEVLTRFCAKVSGS